MIDPTSPSLDRSDPKVMNRAAGVAKRRNTLARRKLPLLADQLPVVTADDVMNQREQARAAWDEIWPEMQRREAESLKAKRDAVLAVVGPEEFAVMEQRRSQGWPEWAYWSTMLRRALLRKTPMSDHSDIVLAILEQWEGPAPTLGELHQRCGDGMTQAEMRTAIDELGERELVTINIGRPCSVTGVPFAATWRALLVRGH